MEQGGEITLRAVEHIGNADDATSRRLAIADNVFAAQAHQHYRVECGREGGWSLYEWRDSIGRWNRFTPVVRPLEDVAMRVRRCFVGGTCELLVIGCRNSLGSRVGEQLLGAMATRWDCMIAFRCQVAIELQG